MLTRGIKTLSLRLDKHQKNAMRVAEFFENHPASMTHESYSSELQEQIGIDSKLLRLAVGVEHEEDLVEDLKNALEKATV